MKLPLTPAVFGTSPTHPNRRVMDKDRFRRDLGNVKTPISKFWSGFSPETAISGKTQADAQKLIGLWCVDVQNKLNKYRYLPSG